MTLETDLPFEIVTLETVLNAEAIDCSTVKPTAANTILHEFC